MTDSTTTRPADETRTAELRRELDRLRFTLDSLGAAGRVTQRMKIQQVERELRAIAAAPAGA